jgi:5-methylcytosine-specific restriction endonuclease McrA
MFGTETFRKRKAAYQRAYNHRMGINRPMEEYRRLRLERKAARKVRLGAEVAARIAARRATRRTETEKRAAQAAWREANRERYRELLRNWKKANPEKVRARKKNRSKRIRIFLKQIQRGRCAICGQRLGKQTHIDHIVPLALGGSNARSNLQLTHPSCNLAKNKRDPIIHAQSLGRLL